MRFSFQDAYKMQMARSRAQPIKCELFWRLANHELVILPSSERKLRKNALRLNQSAFSNFALYVIKNINDKKLKNFHQ